MIILKLALIVAFLFVFLQDNKDRYVYWFLFPIIGVLCGLLFYNSTLPELFLASVLFNSLFVLILVLVLLLYAYFKLKTSLFNTIGLGDILLFVSLTVSFSTIAFIVIFISALFFSLVLHLYKTRFLKTQTTVPLAGYMSLFFLMSYLVHWVGNINVVYVI